MSDISTNDKFWLENPNILFQNNRLIEFFPTINMTFNEKLNSITRLSIYESIIMFAYSGKINYLFVFVCTLILTYLIYKK